MGWTCSADREARNAYSIFEGKSRGKATYGRQRSWKYSITMDQRERDCEDGEWIELAQVRIQ
jgi:hypothetical protein